MTQRHVQPTVDDRWQVVDPTRDLVCVVTETREDAVQRARRALGSLGGGTLVIEDQQHRVEPHSRRQASETVPARANPPRIRP